MEARIGIKMVETMQHMYDDHKDEDEGADADADADNDDEEEEEEGNTYYHLNAGKFPMMIL